MNKTGILLIRVLALSCSSTIAVEQASQNLLNTDKEFAQMSLDKGAGAAFEFYLTEDAMILPHNGNPVNGREIIVKAFTVNPIWDKTELAWTPEKAEVSQSGDMGWTWGKYKQTVHRKSKQSVHNHSDDIVTYGKYLNIWRKQIDGSWKLVVDMGNHSPEPENKLY